LVSVLIIMAGCASDSGFSDQVLNRLAEQLLEGLEEEFPKMTVGVAPFRFMPGETVNADSEFVASRLPACLHRIGGRELRIFTRRHIAELLEEQGRSITDPFDPETGARIGKLIGLTHIVVGDVSRTMTHLLLTVDLVVVETGEIISSVKGNILLKRMIGPAMSRRS